MEQKKADKKECLYALQETGLGLKEATLVYDHFINEGIDFLMLEFILSNQETDKNAFHSLAAELQDEIV